MTWARHKVCTKKYLSSCRKYPRRSGAYRGETMRARRKFENSTASMTARCLCGRARDGERYPLRAAKMFASLITAKHFTGDLSYGVPKHFASDLKFKFPRQSREKRCAAYNALSACERRWLILAFADIF